MARERGDRTRIVGLEDRGGTGDKRFRVKFQLDGIPDARGFATREEAEAFARKFRRERSQETGPTVATMIDEFLGHMVRERHWRPGSQSRDNAWHRLTLMLRHVMDLPIGAVTEADLLSRDRELLDTGYAIKTINETVIITGQFFRWVADKGHRRGNPSTALKRRKGANAGKPGHTIDEAQRFRATVDPAALAGDESALVALIALLLGCRAIEIMTRRPRDIDAGGTILRSWDVKRNKPLPIRIPDVLQAPLMALASRQMAAGKEWLFTARTKQWPNIVVKRWCKRAGVPVITCQGMRGTHDSIAVEIGMAPQAVASATGHSVDVMKRNYLHSGSLASGRVNRVLAVLSGGIDSSANPSQPGNDAASVENQTGSDVAA